MRSGRLITVEGLDGAGKTTLVAGVTRELAARGRELLVLREPGGVELSERIRELVKDPELRRRPARGGAALRGRARAARRRAAGAAARRRPLGPARPLRRLLARLPGGGARALGIEEIRALNLFATGGLTPDRTLLLRIDPAVGRARIAGREADRLERAGEAFFDAVARAYDELAAAEPERFAVIEADRPPEQVVADALAALEPLLSDDA